MESDRRPGESERDWHRRLAEMGAAAKRASRDRDRQASLNAEAEAAQIREAMADEVWLHDVAKDLFGMNVNELDATLNAGTDASNWTRQDQAVLEEWRNAKKPRIFEGKKGRNRRVAKHLKANKSKIEKAAKKGKKGCLSALVVLAGASGGALYGLFEAGHAIVSAMGH